MKSFIEQRLQFESRLTQNKTQANVACCDANNSVDKTLMFIQNISSDVWTIPHNMRKIPCVHFFDESNNEMFPDWNPVDENNIIAIFSESVSGKVYLN